MENGAPTPFTTAPAATTTTNIYHPSCSVSTKPGQLQGRAAPATFDELLEVIKAWHRGFPDLSHSFDEVFSKDDRVVVRGRTRGTHKGEFMGIAPTGRSLELTFICIFRLADGRLAERWPQFDFYNWMEQLRAAPE